MEELTKKKNVMPTNITLTIYNDAEFDAADRNRRVWKQINIFQKKNII